MIDGAVTPAPEEQGMSHPVGCRCAGCRQAKGLDGETSGRNPPPSGGAGHGSGKRHEDKCPVCGGKVLPGIERVISRDELEQDPVWEELPDGRFIHR
jgi:hypothetical protein